MSATKSDRRRRDPSADIADVAEIDKVAAALDELRREVTDLRRRIADRLRKRGIAA